MDSIHTQISCVLIFYDGYQNCLADSREFLVTAKQDLMKVTKDGGCLVLCNCEESKLDIQIKSKRYQTKDITIYPRQQGEEIPFYRIWMYPGKLYQADSELVMLEGTAQPFCHVLLFLGLARSTCRLLADIDKEDRCISIYHKKNEALEGREILLHPQKIRMLLGEEMNHSAYQFQFSTKNRCCIKKNEVSIFLGYEGMTDGSGNYQIAVNKTMIRQCTKGFLYCNDKDAEIQIAGRSILEVRDKNIAEDV